MPDRTLPSIAPNWAFFLDVDGTLLEIADHPDAVHAGPRLRTIVTNLFNVTGGAMALVSGRNIASLDRLFAPMVLPAAGLHGLERRDARSRLHYAYTTETQLHEVKYDLMRFVEQHPGLLLEDKGPATALHYRNAPQMADKVIHLMHETQRRLGEEFELQFGKMVVELKPSGHNKGHAIEAFMLEPPFRGRVPVFIGDDVTDEDGFGTVNRMGGYSVRVGPTHHSEAVFSVPDVGAVLDWLDQYCRDGAAAFGNSTPTQP